MNPRTLAGIGAAAALSVMITATPAVAKDGDVIRRGSCSSSADWKLKASPEDGRIEVEGEVDSNRNGQVWRWRIVHNGDVSARGRATTHRPSGSFEVHRTVVNLSGTDSITFVARHRKSGQVCRGTVRF
jgi:hypothetical protein